MKIAYSRLIFEKKNLQISNFMKIRPEGAQLLHEGGRTDMTKLIVTFRNFAWKWLGFVFFWISKAEEIPNRPKLN